MRNWYCAMTSAQREGQVKKRLTAAGVECYLPEMMADRRFRRPKIRAKATVKPTPVPMFPGYIFFTRDKGHQDFATVKGTKELLKVIQFGAEPTIVPDEIISALKAMEDHNGIHSAHKHSYEAGDAVRIKAGPFEHTEAIIKAMDITNGEERAVILLDIIGRSVKVAVDVESLEPVAA